MPRKQQTIPLTPAQQQLADSCVRLACKLAVAFANRRVKEGQAVDEDGLVSRAGWALVKAAQHFDPSRGFKFTTYASAVISRELNRWYKDEGAVIHYPSYAPVRQQLSIDYQYQQTSYAGGDGYIEADAVLGLKADLSAPLEYNMGQVIARLLAAIPDRRDRLCVRLRYLEGMTLEQVGDRLGISKERVRQICRKWCGLLRVRAAWAEDYLED